MPTTAHAIALLYCHDSSAFYDDNNVHIEERMNRAGGTVSFIDSLEHDNAVKYTFPDGSSIYVTPRKWYIAD